MLVRALEACFIDGQRRRRDAEFEYAGEVLPAHLVPVKSAPAKTEATAPTPVAISELTKGATSFVEAVAKKRK